MSKTFVIEHPLDENKYLVHGCLEGPEGGVYYRGRGEIIDTKMSTITLPDYVRIIATDWTIQVTPMYNGQIRNLNVTEIIDGVFNVYGETGGFYWVAYGKRIDLNVEPLKNMVNVKGVGPYKWV